MSRRSKAAARAGSSRPSAAHVVGAGRPRWPFAVIAAAGVAAYVNALGHPFLFDDVGAIAENATIRSLWGSLAGGPAQLPTAGRPIPNFTFALNYALGGLQPWGYHASNLAIHVLCALLLFALLRRVLGLPRLSSIVGGRENGFALAIALLWTVHPLNSELVDYATQRTESLMALALLATLYAGVRAATVGRTPRWATASVVACVLGMACKESMVTAPVLMLLLDATFISSGIGDALRKRRAYYAALFATWIVLGALIVEGPRWRSAGLASGLSPWTYLLNQPPLILRYLRLAVWPVGQVVDYGTPATIALGAVWLPGAIVLLLVAVTVGAWFWNPFVAYAATWVFITLAPTSSILPIATEVGAERRMYLPLVGVLTLIVFAADRLLQARSQGARRVTIDRGVVAAVCVVLAALTMIRNREYASGVTIWQTAVARYPTGRAHYNLGMELRAAGRRADALAQYRIAAATSPEAHYALGFEAAADGHHREAIEEYRRFISAKPLDIDVPRAYHSIGRSYMALGQHADAAAAFREVLARKPGNADALSGLADSLLAANQLPEAVAAYQEYLRRNPQNPAAVFNMGLALVKLDRDADARDAFATVVQMQPTNVAAHVNLAYALANTNRLGDAVREFRRAAELEPDPAARDEIRQAIAQLMGSH